MKRVVAFFLSLTGFNVYALDIKVIDSNNKPVSEAVCTLTDLTTGKTAVCFPDNSGTITLFVPEHPSLLLIKCLGFYDFTDTLYTTSASRIITLTRNNVDLNEVVITSSYAPQPATTSVYQFQVIDRSRIEKQAALNLADVMNQQLNARILNDPFLGSSLSLQGMTGQNIKFLIDGVPVTGRLNGNIDLSQINLNTIERIEIINGPMSVQYGTDAIGGVINLITKKNPPEKINAIVDAYYESIGQYNAGATLSGRFKKASWMINGGRNFFDGWSLADSGRTSDWKPKEQLFATTRFGYLFNALKLTYTGGVFNEVLKNKGEPVITPYYARATDEEYTTRRITSQLNADYRLNAEKTFSLLTAYSFYQRTKQTYIKDLVHLSQELSDDNSRQDTTSFNTWTARGTFSSSSDLSAINYQAGFDATYETGTGKRITNQKASGDFALFATAEWKIKKKLTIKPGARIAYNTLYPAPVVPSIHFKYDFNSGSSVRFAYSRGFRAPVLKELYLSFVDVNHNVQGNENLKPEYSNNFLLGYSLHQTVDRIKIKVEPQLYYNEMKNLITLAQPDPDSSLYTYINIGKYKTLGAQLNINASYEQLHVSAGFAYAGKYNIAYGTADVPEFLYSPEFSTGTDYTFKKSKTTVALFYKYNGSQPIYLFNDDGKTVSQFRNSPYSLFDATLIQKIFKEHVTITAGIKNLLDEKTIKQFTAGEAHSSGSEDVLIAPGRSFFFKIQYSLFSQ